MSEQDYRCKYCNAPLQGNSEMCVQCFRIATIPCPECMVRSGRHGEAWQPKKKRGNPVDCKHCHNERWLLSLARLSRYLRFEGRMPDMEEGK